MLTRIAHRMAMWFGHYNVHAAILGFAVVILGGFVLALDGLPSWLDLTVRALTVAAIAASAYGTFSRYYHDRNVCDRHIIEAPLDDPDGAVQRNRRKLRLFHRLTPGMVMKVAVVFLVASALMQFVFHVPTVVLHLPLIGFASALSYLAWSCVVHRRLEPWCPYCRRGGGDDGFEPVDPTRPHGVRPNPVNA